MEPLPAVREYYLCRSSATPHAGNSRFRPVPYKSPRSDERRKRTVGGNRERHPKKSMEIATPVALGVSKKGREPLFHVPLGCGI